MDREKRKRIIKDKGELVKDELSFTENLGSKNAREIKTITEQISLEIWYDKHYTIREQHGDDDGKREGIGQEVIEFLVEKSLKHLLFYSARIKGYTFLNHESDAITRTILRDSYSQDEILTVATQIHFKNLNKYQVTVITAMCGEFRLGAGQYVVDFVDENSSILYRLDNGKITEVFSCQD